MGSKEWFRLDNLTPTLLTGLAFVATWLVGVFSQGVYPIVQQVAQALPTEVRLVGLVLLLLLLVVALGVILTLREENKRLKQQPVWHPALGAKWKYWPVSKRFDPRPYCICCDAPHPWRSHGIDGEKRHVFCCPSREPSWENHYFLQPDDQPENYLSIPQALALLPSRL